MYVSAIVPFFFFDFSFIFAELCFPISRHDFQAPRVVPSTNTTWRHFPGAFVHFGFYLMPFQTTWPPPIDPRPHLDDWTGPTSTASTACIRHSCMIRVAFSVYRRCRRLAGHGTRPNNAARATVLDPRILPKVRRSRGAFPRAQNEQKLLLVDRIPQSELVQHSRRHEDCLRQSSDEHGPPR